MIPETSETQGESTEGGATKDPYTMVDPNGLQTSATGAALLGLGAVIVDSGTGDTVGSLLDLGTRVQEVATAGLTLHSLANMGLFSIGVLLIALSVLLNVASLTIRWQHALSTRYSKRKSRGVLESGTASSRAQEPYPMADQNRRR